MDSASSGIDAANCPPILGGGSAAQRGFSLLEILVSFVLLALALATIMQIFSRGINGAALADNYAKATMLAESQLAVAGVQTPLKEGVSSGKFNDDFAWDMVVTPYIDPQQNPANPLNPLLSVQLFEVVLRVQFLAGDTHERNVTLTTLRLVPKL